MLANFEKLEKPNKLFADEKIKHQLFRCLDKSVKEIVENYKEIPIAFSGGLDSSVLAYLASKYTKPILFCVGFEDSYDARNAKRAVEILNDLSLKNLNMSVFGAQLRSFGVELRKRAKHNLTSILLNELELNIIYLDKIDLEKYLRKTIEIVGTDDKLIIDLNLPYFILLEELKKRGYKNFISGQGADELFAGYNRYKKSENLEDDLLQDIKEIYKTNQQYNLKIENHFGVKSLFPFLEEEVVKLAVRISSDLKIKNGINKYILREAFREFLPEKIIAQNKKAFQYGSGASKAIKKLKAKNEKLKKK